MEVEYITGEYQPLVDLIQSSNELVYSTDERKIGKWIDGKPLYQKTYITTTPSTTDLQSVIVDITSLSIDTVVNINGLLHSTSLNQFIPIEFPFSTNVLLSTWVDNQKIMQMVPSSNYTNCAESVTIQYTKSTATTRTLSKGATDSLKADLSEEKKEIEELPTTDETTVKKAQGEAETKEEADETETYEFAFRR